MNITKLQADKIKDEILYYLKYDKFLNEIDKNSLLSIVEELSSFKVWDYKPNLNNWPSIIKDYFISHTDHLGNVVSLEHHAFNNYEVKKYLRYFKEIEHLFISKLMEYDKPLYYLDVDNTLTDNAYLSPAKIDFISNWENKKNIILNTGKVSASIMNVIEACNLHNNYYACLNGSVIAKEGTFEIIDCLGSISESIINDLNKTNINYITYYENQIHVIKELNDENIYFLKKYNEWFIDKKKPTDYQRIIKILTFIHENEPEKENIVRKIVMKHPHLISVRTAEHCFEILNKDQHKGNSVKRIAEYMNKYYRCSVGVGDSMNDLRMLDYVGYPYVVSNVSLELKKYDFSIVEGSRDKDIVNILNKYSK